MTLKVGADRSRSWSMFETEVQPGFDVGAHRHREAEEVFYILDGELDLLAFEPCDSAPADWRSARRRASASYVAVPAASWWYHPGARTPSPTQDRPQSACSSSSPRPATSTTWKKWRACSPAGRRTRRRSRLCGNGTTSPN